MFYFVYLTCRLLVVSSCFFRLIEKARPYFSTVIAQLTTATLVTTSSLEAAKAASVVVGTVEHCPEIEAAKPADACLLEVVLECAPCMQESYSVSPDWVVVH